jgi:SAM-dependent methyltransferase
VQAEPRTVQAAALSSPYGRSFYADRNAQTQYAARTVLGHLWPLLPRIDAVADVGCGVGTWLAAAQGLGASVIAGVDGPWVDRSLLAIPNDCFRTADLSQPLDLGRRFDLALSLEVAEHLPATRAADFVATLTGLADVVLFAAAIPFQGGTGHVNEQWPEYWSRLFEQRGYATLDVIRPAVWSDVSIPFWYRQNTLLYVQREHLAQLRLPATLSPRPFGGLAVVHPELYESRQQKLATLGGSLQAVKRALRAKLMGR